MESIIISIFNWFTLELGAEASVALITLLFLVFTFSYQRKHSERAVQPVIIFFPVNGTEMWAFKNVGKEPAINIVLFYKQEESDDWISNEDWPIGFPGIMNDDKPIVLLDIKGPNSLRAEYEDINKNSLSTTICGNRNKIKRYCWLRRRLKSIINFGQLKSAKKHAWELHSHMEGIPEGYVGITTKPKHYPRKLYSFTTKVKPNHCSIRKAQMSRTGFLTRV